METTMEKKSAEQRAEERFPAFKLTNRTGRQDGYATCIREEVEPLEAEVAKFRALVQELANDMRRLRIEFGNRTGTTTQIGVVSLVRANEHGFVPTNTTEG